MKAYLGWILAGIFVLLMFILKGGLLKIILSALAGMALVGQFGLQTIDLSGISSKLNLGRNNSASTFSLKNYLQ
jgi:uncharacterized membrane protein